MVKKKHLKILIVIFLIVVIIQSSYFILQTNNLEKSKIVAKAVKVGEVSLGINHPPQILGLFSSGTTPCPTSIRENTEITCTLAGYDADENNITFSDTGVYSQPTSIKSQSLNTNPKAQDVSLPVTVLPNGTVTIKSYIGTIGNYGSLLGNHSINFYVFDNSGVDNAMGDIYIHNLEIYDVNDPPILSSSISNQVILKDQDLIILELNDYFSDPDYGQTLTYSVSGSSSILVSIVASTKVVAYSSVCKTETVIFTATDPYGLQVSSNSVEIKVNCDSGSGDTTSSSGSSGSSASGSSSSLICISKWECEAWEDCTINGTQKRRCVDQRACDPNNFIYWLYQNCTYVDPSICQEVWKCGEWSECLPNNQQTRNCEELNNCDTQLDKPETAKVCSYIPTCEDGIQNQEETGIDCGGPCLPCQSIQTPGVVENQQTISGILLIIATLLLSLLLVYKYFHKEINTVIARTLLMMIEKRKKRIFLSENNPKELLDRLWIFEKSINNKNLKKKTMELAVIGREYFSRSTMNVRTVFSKEQLEQAIISSKIQAPLDNIFTSFYEQIRIFETKKLKVYKIDLLIFLEELREIIQLTANISLEDEASKKNKEIKELSINDSDSDLLSIKKNIYNAYITMQFGEIDICKNKYSQIIKLYENLSEENKNLFYSNITRLFNEIKYFISITE